MNKNLDPDKEQLTPVEAEVERALRPKIIDDFMGQPKIVDNLFVFIKAAKQRNEALDHVLLHGPPGLGKQPYRTSLPMKCRLISKLHQALLWKSPATLPGCLPT